MYTQLASKLAVDNGSEEYSQAVSMAGGNAVEVEATAFANGGTLEMWIQVANDLQNWEDINPSTADLSFTGGAVGYDHARLESIAAQYVRIRYKQTTGTGIVAAGINVANL